MNTAAVHQRAANLQSRKAVKGSYQAAWLLRAVTCIDLTTLGGDDTDSNVMRLCAKVKRQNYQKRIIFFRGNFSKKISFAGKPSRI